MQVKAEGEKVTIECDLREARHILASAKGSLKKSKGAQDWDGGKAALTTLSEQLEPIAGVHRRHD